MQTEEQFEAGKLFGFQCWKPQHFLLQKKNGWLKNLKIIPPQIAEAIIYFKQIVSGFGGSSQ